MPQGSAHKDPLDHSQNFNASFTVPKITYFSAYLTEIWERLWPLLVWTFICACLYAIVSWAGLWRQLDDIYRNGLMLIFGIAAIISLYPLRNFKLPFHKEVLNRIENASSLEDRPLTAQNDGIALAANDSTEQDAFTKALWAEHQKRMASRLENLSSGMPRPDGNILDKFALRAMLPIIAFVAWGFSFGSTGGSLLDGFSRHIDKAQILSRLDVWANSPAYTARPPIYISTKKPKNEKSEITEFTLLNGSTFNLRYLGAQKNENATVQFITRGDTLQIPQSQNEHAESTNKFELTHTLTQSGEFQFLINEEIIESWSIKVEEDSAPTIDFAQDPKAALSGSLELAYKVEDDFGVISAKGHVRSLVKQLPNARPLVAAPTFEIPLPRRRAKSSTAKVNRDLSNHPWAGSLVTLTLEAYDDAKQSGTTAPYKFTLPGRNFKNNLALALIEQRRLLAFNANQADYIADLLDAVTQFPEEFKIKAETFLAMRTAYRMIKDANTANDDGRLLGAMDLLWETAIQLEYGDLSDAERKLREAQEKLSEALKNDASDEEIKKLMDELRSAMAEFVKEMQRQMAQNPQDQNPQSNPNSSQTLTQKDLDKMMDRIEDLARSGSKDAARQLLSEMQRMMDNMRQPQPQQNQTANNELNKALDKLSEMMQKQQDLMDQSLAMQNKLREQQQKRQEQKQREQQGKNTPKNDTQDSKQMTPEEFAQAMKELQKQQDALKKQLGNLGDEMEKLGLDPSKGFGEAESEMGTAGKDLKGQNPGSAAGAQSRALQALRDGANQILQQMAQGEDGSGQAGNGQSGGQGQPNGQGRDPLGRTQPADGKRSLDSDTDIPSEIDARRAREIMEAIRKRLSNPLRPSLEKKYLERLLETR